MNTIIFEISIIILVFCLFIIFFIRIVKATNRKSLERKMRSIRASSPYSNPEITKKNTFSDKKDNKKPNYRDKNAEINVLKEKIASKAAKAGQENPDISEIEDISTLERYNADTDNHLGQESRSTEIENDEQIVGIAPAKGKWTKLVMSSHLMKLMMFKNTGLEVGGRQGRGNFWQNFVRVQRSQQQNQEKQHDRGRGMGG